MLSTFFDHAQSPDAQSPDAPSSLRASIGALPQASADRLFGGFSEKSLTKGCALTHQGQPHWAEIILVSGQLVSLVTDHEGRSVCVGLFVGPCVITPNIARTSEGTSLVTLEVTRDAVFGQMRSQDLEALMIADEAIRIWGNDVLRHSLMQKSAREWSLAALDAAGRLAWFRDQYAGYEDLFGHKYIASFLGMTPITLSRLRGRG